MNLPFTFAFSLDKSHNFDLKRMKNQKDISENGSCDVISPFSLLFSRFQNLFVGTIQFQNALFIVNIVMYVLGETI